MTVVLLVHLIQSGLQDRWGPLEENPQALYTGSALLRKAFPLESGADSAGSVAMDPGSPTAATINLTGVSKTE